MLVTAKLFFVIFKEKKYPLSCYSIVLVVYSDTDPYQSIEEQSATVNRTRDFDAWKGPALPTGPRLAAAFGRKTKRSALLFLLPLPLLLTFTPVGLSETVRRIERSIAHNVFSRKLFRVSVEDG